MVVSEELKAEIGARRADLIHEKAKAETAFVKGPWVSDREALKNTNVRRAEQQRRRAPKRLAQATLMKLESKGGVETEEGEVPDRVTQSDILGAVDTQTKRKRFDLVLDKLGPYKIDFSCNGTHLALGGLRGHLANVKWSDFSLVGETQLKDRISDVKFLVDHSMMAVAQKRFVYMYTKEGVEMHLLQKMANMDRLGYLSRHMLLVATSSQYSTMQYLDISTGESVATKPPSVVRDPTTALGVNPGNGTVATCDVRGVVKVWSPSVVDPLLQLKAHRGSIQDIAFHQNGRFFATVGGDHKMKLWDCRTLRPLEEFAVTYAFDTLDISSNGLVALGGGTNIQIWTNMFSASKPSAPFHKFRLDYGCVAQQVRFCPFEDVLGVGHSKGFTSIIVPGSGEANPDFYYANPYETEHHRKQRVVTSLLDKLPPDTITLDLQVGTVNTARLEEYSKSLSLSRRARGIREKRQRRGASRPTQQPVVGVALDNDDEVDEELGFADKSAVKELKSKKELLKEKKMKRWDQKDTADKVRSKQTMRHSKIVKQKRTKHQREEKRRAATASSPEEDGTSEPQRKRGRTEAAPQTDDSHRRAPVNAALLRLR